MIYLKHILINSSQTKFQDANKISEIFLEHKAKNIFIHFQKQKS